VRSEYCDELFAFTIQSRAVSWELFAFLSWRVRVKEIRRSCLVLEKEQN